MGNLGIAHEALFLSCYLVNGEIHDMIGWSTVCLEAGYVSRFKDSPTDIYNS